MAGAAAFLIAAIALAGWLLAIPHGLATVRLFGISLGWWAALAAVGVAVTCLIVGSRGEPGGAGR